MAESALLLGVAVLVFLAACIRGSSGRDASAQRIELHLPVPPPDRASRES